VVWRGAKEKAAEVAEREANKEGERKWRAERRWGKKTPVRGKKGLWRALRKKKVTKGCL